jgi:uncharacterized RDD family membrane protein YckC
MRFCVKCGAQLAPSPEPGSWKAPSGNLNETVYDIPQGAGFGQPSGGLGNQPGAGSSQPSGGFSQPSGGLSEPRSYSAPPVAYVGYGGAVTSAGLGGQPFADWIDRVLAALIDGGISFALMIVLYIIIGVVGGGLMAIGGSLGDAGGAIGGLGFLSCCFGILLAAVSVFVVGIYNKVFLVSKRGFSIGQGIMKLKVLDSNGNLPQIGTLVLRLLVQIGLGVIPIVGLANALWPLWDEKKQTLHDKAVGTFVVKTG